MRSGTRWHASLRLMSAALAVALSVYAVESTHHTHGALAPGPSPSPSLRAEIAKPGGSGPCVACQAGHHQTFAAEPSIAVTGVEDLAAAAPLDEPVFALAASGRVPSPRAPPLPSPIG